MPDPFRKGRLGRPVEFGYKAQVLDNTDGIVLDHEVMVGNPPDAPLLAPAIERTRKPSWAEHPDCRHRGSRLWRSDRRPRADRPRRAARGHPSKRPCPRASGTSSSVRKASSRLVKWRTGSEGRISHLKCSWGWNRTRLDGIDGARTWCGWGVLAHNATKIALLIEERATPQPATDVNQRLATQTTGPPSTTSTATN